jgi:hypothetical protein
MKKIILFSMLCIATLTTFGQRNSERHVHDFYGGISVGGTYKSAQNITISKIVEMSGQLAFIDADGDTLINYVPLAQRVDIATVAMPLDSTWTTTVPIGACNATDVALFTVNNTFPLGKWSGDYDIVITGVNAVAVGTSPDVDIALLYDANYRDATPTEVFSADLTVTSTTTGNNATINTSNDTIIPGQFWWIRIDEATTPPTQLVVTISYHLE